MWCRVLPGDHSTRLWGAGGRGSNPLTHGTSPPLEKLLRAPQASFLYATSHGAYAGVSYEGAAFFSRRDVNRAFYGEHHAIDDIIGGRIPRPAVAQPLYDILAKSSADFQRARSGVDDDGQY